MYIYLCVCVYVYTLIRSAAPMYMISFYFRCSKSAHNSQVQILNIYIENIYILKKILNIYILNINIENLYLRVVN